MADADRYTTDCTEQHLHVAFAAERTVLSSAVLGGGLCPARHIVNLRVPKNNHLEKQAYGPPEETIRAYSRRRGWDGPVVGMMTAASMDSFRRVDRQEQGVTVTTLVTAGVSNAVRSGDPADCRVIGEATPEAGTVNIIVVTNARLTEAALVEAAMAVTEAKAAAFANLGIRSISTGQPATGTGTDAVAIAAGNGPTAIRFCGKHLLFGEMLADTTIRAISDSLRE